MSLMLELAGLNGLWRSTANSSISAMEEHWRPKRPGLFLINASITCSPGCFFNDECIARSPFLSGWREFPLSLVQCLLCFQLYGAIKLKVDLIL